MTGKQPAFMFYPGDWLKDPDLSKCSLATRGAWIELLCAMHENGRTGIITGTVAELAQICRTSKAEMKRALEQLRDLETADVTFCNAPYQKCTVVNRRMHREYKEREGTKLRVRRYREKDHGNGNVTPSSSCSYSYSCSEEGLVSEKISRERESSSAPKPGTLSTDFTDEFLDKIQESRAYKHLDVRAVFEKFKTYFEINGGTGNTRHFLGWLNREEVATNRNESSDARIKRAFSGSG